MYTIYYNYNAGEFVWIAHEDDAIECRVYRVVLEVDPDSVETIVERKTYHLTPKDDSTTVLLRPEDQVFNSLTDALNYITDPELTASSTTAYNIVYSFTVDQVVWTYEDHYPLESSIVQITFDIKSGVTPVPKYHVLPVDEEYSTIFREEQEIFNTYDAVMQYITAIVCELTPTPTVSPTMTVTPATTTTTTPEPTSSSAVTSTPTITPTTTPIPSPLPFDVIRYDSNWQTGVGEDAITSFVNLNGSETGRVLQVWGGYYAHTTQAPSKTIEFNGVSIAPTIDVAQTMGSLHNRIFSINLPIPDNLSGNQLISVVFGEDIITKFIAYTVTSDSSASIRSFDTLNDTGTGFTSHSTTISRATFPTDGWAVGCFISDDINAVPTSASSTILNVDYGTQLNLTLFKQFLPDSGTYINEMGGYTGVSHNAYGITVEQSIF